MRKGENIIYKGIHCLPVVLGDLVVRVLVEHALHVFEALLHCCRVDHVYVLARVASVVITLYYVSTCISSTCIMCHLVYHQPVYCVNVHIINLYYVSTYISSTYIICHLVHPQPILYVILYIINLYYVSTCISST